MLVQRVPSLLTLLVRITHPPYTARSHAGVTHDHLVFRYHITFYLLDHYVNSRFHGFLYHDLSW